MHTPFNFIYAPFYAIYIPQMHKKIILKYINFNGEMMRNETDMKTNMCRFISCKGKLNQNEDVLITSASLQNIVPSLAFSSVQFPIY